MAWTSPKTWVDGVDSLSATNLNTHIRDNQKAATEWTAYTPTWTTGTIGNGTLSGRYIIAGDVCHLRVNLVWGSTTSSASPNWIFSLPPGGVVATARGLIMWVANDHGTRVYSGISQMEVGSTSTPWLFRDDSGSGVGAGAPMTWATNDSLTLSATYEV